MKKKTEHIYNWYNRPLGQAILAMEQATLKNLSVKLFGQYILQLGGPNNINLLDKTNVQTQIYLDPKQAYLPAQCDISICGDFAELPFLPASIDAAIIFHALEFTKMPRQVLRELFDVLVPEGYVLIFGFNAYSFFRLLRLLKGKTNTVWFGHYINSKQLRQWFGELGFSVIDYQTLFFRPFMANKKLYKFLFMEGLGQLFCPTFGGVYMFLIQKRVGALTLVRQSKLKQLFPVPAKTYVEPTVRS